MRKFLTGVAVAAAISLSSFSAWALNTVVGVTSVQVMDKDLTLAPLFPSEGDCYIVVLGLVPPWTGHAGDVAYFEEGAWTFFTPPTGIITYVIDEAALYQRLSNGTQTKLTQADLNAMGSQTIFSGKTNPSYPASPADIADVRAFLVAHHFMRDAP